MPLPALTHEGAPRGAPAGQGTPRGSQNHVEAFVKRTPSPLITCCGPPKAMKRVQGELSGNDREGRHEVEENKHWVAVVDSERIGDVIYFCDICEHGSFG